MADSFRRPTIGSAVIYKDPTAALAFLETAFGFERIMVIHDDDGHLVHAELRLGGGYIMIGPEWAEHVASPASLGGKNSQSVHVHLDGDIEAHCARAQAAGAEVVRELAEQFWGDRMYSAKDLEGHVWSFGETVRQVSREEAEAASGLKIEGWM